MFRTIKNSTDKMYPITPFADQIVDFALHLSEESNKSLLVVLTEKFIFLLDATKGEEFVKDEITVLRYHRYNLADAGYPYITPPVTCFHHCGKCSEIFMNKLKAASKLPSLTEEQTQLVPDLVVTGHSDGSIRLWLCYCNSGSLSFKLLRMAINTGDYFDDIQKDAVVLTDDVEQKLAKVSLVKVIDSQYLLVITKSARVLLFSLWRFESDKKPQSQEIVLKGEFDGHLPKAIKTPSPHFRPHEQNKHVQLLQHFSCHYQSGHDQPLEPVHVNCADYNEQMRMLAVGTEYGLVVLDTKKNVLVQVIGSENKLLKLCLKPDENIPDHCSEKDCDVVCLETAMISWKDKAFVEEAQHTLWVGTRGGTLGALNIMRKEGQVLELKATGLGKHFKESIKGIHFHQNTQQSKKETDFNGDEEIDFFTSNIAVTMEKDVQTFLIPGLKEKSRTFEHKDIVWRGLIQSYGKPFIIYVTKDEHKLVGLCLTDLGYTISKNLPADCHPVEQDLFSSNGKHAIMKCSDRFYYIMDSA